MYLPTWLILNSEKKVRKHWLFATSIFFVFCPLDLLTGSIFAPRQGSISEEEFYAAFAATLIGTIVLCLGWYCCYKKCGTRLLTFWLYITPIRRLTHLVGSLSKEIPTMGMLVGMVIDIAVFIWWYVLSIKLRKINKAIQAQKSLEPQIITEDEEKTNVQPDTPQLLP